MTMVYCIATREWEGWLKCVRSWTSHAATAHFVSLVKGCDVLEAFQTSYQRTHHDILAFLHDDLMIHEANWDERILREFDDPFVGVVGVAGALGHGSPSLYAGDYHLPNLARQHFMSNMRDAERHGARFKGERDVAILDGMALFVRRPILDKVGGWPVNQPVGYWLYSEWLCCEARRQGYRIRLVGIDVDHLGGKSSGFISPKITYEAAHRWLYDHNHDMLPYRVPE
jgi:GT2 family glycosyltransferase